MSKTKSNTPDKWAGATKLTDYIYYKLSETENPTFWHWCTVNKRWHGQGTAAHMVESTEPLDMSPSLLWDCCGLHGFVKDGKWVLA